MADDEYEIVPLKELHTIKEQLKELKSAVSPEELSVSALPDKKLRTPIYSESSKELIEAMGSLTSAIRDLINLFRSGKSELDSKKEATSVAQKNSQSSIKIDTLIDQNKAIAKGILLLVNLLSGKENEKQNLSLQQNLQQQNSREFSSGMQSTAQQIPTSPESFGINAPQSQMNYNNPYNNYNYNKNIQIQSPQNNSMPPIQSEKSQIPAFLKGDSNHNASSFQAPPVPPVPQASHLEEKKNEPSKKKSIFRFR